MEAKPVHGFMDSLLNPKAAVLPRRLDIWAAQQRSPTIIYLLRRHDDVILFALAQQQVLAEKKIVRRDCTLEV